MKLPERVEGWKAIATILGQSVRTAQRWHARGLPVYRGRNTGRVWAFPAELLRWRDEPVPISTKSPKR